MKGRGFGLVVLLVVVVTVLLLVAKSWQRLAPTALEVQAASQPPGNTTSARPEPVRTAPGALPRLQEARQATDQHKSQVRDALAATE